MKQQLPERHGFPWLPGEDKLLIHELEELGWERHRMAREHKRTLLAIVLRIEHLTNKEKASMPQLETPNGKFWMLQNGEMRPATNVDAYGNRILDYPGRSVFLDKPTAVAAAKEMAERHPNKKFYLMEAVEVFETKRPPITRTKL